MVLFAPVVAAVNDTEAQAATGLGLAVAVNGDGNSPTTNADVVPVTAAQPVAVTAKV